MPELPEVERARKLIAETCTGGVIDELQCADDAIVFAGDEPAAFVKEIQGRTITGCHRRGKQFWLTLSGPGRYLVMHFGMTGMIQLRGQEPTWYRRKIHLGETVDSWPPNLMDISTPGGETLQLAFIDPRRLGRLRLVPDPVLSHPPLSELGFDPVLDHPTLDEFKTLLETKKGTIKGVIMDQSFSAGVGNWVADEVLYHSRIHPMCPVPALSESEVAELHRHLRDIPLRAIEVNADSELFPDNWLFRWRWDKGRKAGKAKKKAVKDEEDVKPALEFLALPDGGKATIQFVTVGGRTSAVVSELQKMPANVVIKPKAKRGKKKRGDESELSEEEAKPKPTTTVRSKRARATKAEYKEDSELSEIDDEQSEKTKARKRTR